MRNLNEIFNEWSKKKANVWITTLSVLFVIVVAIFFTAAASGNGKILSYLSSDAAGFRWWDVTSWFKIQPRPLAGIQVTSPKASDKWVVGQTNNITWVNNIKCGPRDASCGTGSAADFTGTVTITLHKPDPACLYTIPACKIPQEEPFTIATGVANSGTFPWTVADIPDRLIGVAVQITVKTESSAGISPSFMIVKTGTGPGGAHVGGRFNLKVSQSAELSDAGIKVTFVGIESIACTNSIPPHCTDGAKLQVQRSAAVSADSGIQEPAPTTFTLGVGEKRDNVLGFTVTLDSLTSDTATLEVINSPATTSAIHVVAPNGGESWQRGSTQTLRWTAPSSVSSVNINLVEYRNCPEACVSTFIRQYPLANQTANDGSFSWTVGIAKGGGSIPDGQYLAVIDDGKGNSDQSDSPFSITSSQPSGDSGIEGIITIGPTCGGPISYGDCADKPYQTTIIATSETGAVTKFSSGSDGRFRVNLAAGTYTLTQASTSKLPYMSPQTVIVKSGAYTEVSLMFDSGLR